MKSISISSLVFICILLLSQSSCTKKKISNLVKTETSSNGTTAYTYDENGRRSTAEYPDGLEMKYTYSSNRVNEDCYRNGLQTCAGVYNLNAQGYDNANGTRLYNSQGYLLREFDGTFYTYYGYSNGNISTDTTLNTSGQIRLISKYEYYEQEDNRDWGLAFRGNRSKNALKRISRYSSQSSDSTVYSYQYNDEGQITQQVFSNVNGTFTTSYTY